MLDKRVPQIHGLTVICWYFPLKKLFGCIPHFQTHPYEQQWGHQPVPSSRMTNHHLLPSRSRQISFVDQNQGLCPSMQGPGAKNRQQRLCEDLPVQWEISEADHLAFSSCLWSTDHACEAYALEVYWLFEDRCLVPELLWASMVWRWR